MISYVHKGPSCPYIFDLRWICWHLLGKLSGLHACLHQLRYRHCIKEPKSSFLKRLAWFVIPKLMPITMLQLTHRPAYKILFRLDHFLGFDIHLINRLSKLGFKCVPVEELWCIYMWKKLIGCFSSDHF